MPSPPTRQYSEYDLDELEPRPDDPLLHDDQTLRSTISTPDPWQDNSSNSSRNVMFAGPPPPIASAKTRRSSGQRKGIGSLLFDYNHETQPSYKNTTWRMLRSQEKAIEREVQQLLDLQANGLVAGIKSDSDTGSSTPTGTFYSSNSRMVNSLYTPTRSNGDGNVIPVRQSTKPKGLRAARSGIKTSISALAHLKLEEDSYVEEALSQRRRMLNTMDRLGRRRRTVSNELHILEQDEEEPLGVELRELEKNYDSLTMDIHTLEEKLVAMRKQQRWIKGEIESVKNNREAGLSGYRGALQEVDSEVKALMTRPPIQPLDQQVLDTSSTGGSDFLRLLPQRRTLEMATHWLRSEVHLLQQHKLRIDADRRALDEGVIVWEEVVRVVSEHEARLRGMMNKDSGHVLGEMNEVVKVLERHMQHAESSRWNLLICAIGAELEAFTTARGMLSRKSSQSPDNEVPHDLLVDSSKLKVEGPKEDTSRTDDASSKNEVPAEFLAEHD